MHRLRTTAIYSAAHYLVDFGCAYLVLRHVPGTESYFEAVLIYNFCAFALQMPLGVLTDRFGNGRMFAAAGCVLVSVSGFLADRPLAICAAAGIGNALFHIGGGTDVLHISHSRAGLLGVFVSPGAFGLFMGSLLRNETVLQPVCMAALAVFAAGILLGCPRIEAKRLDQDVRPRSSCRLLWLVPVFAVVCIRSCGGFLFSFSWKSGAWIWILTACVVLGKALGGFLYDRFGGIRTAVVTLGAGALLFALSDQPVAGCAAVLLFNMTMPVTLRAAADILHPGQGFSFGLLTFALFVGFIPIWMGVPWTGSSMVCSGMCLVTLALLAPVLRRERL